MEILLWVLVITFTAATFILLIKNHLLRKSVREIDEAIQDLLEEETNCLIDLSSRDRHLRKLADDLNIQLKKLRAERQRHQQGNLDLAETVTNIAHDLRTPLTAICGYLELLKKEEGSKEALQYLAIIEERTNALRQLTEELFRYSIISSTEPSGLEEISINRLIEEALSAYYAVLTGCGITLEVSLPEQDVIRRLNPNALSRILGNILSNAVKYSAGDLRITLSETGQTVISNHAPDLDPIQAGKLFDRYYTVRNAKHATGLGLSIAKTLTEQMQGTIQASYEDGQLFITLQF